MTAREQRVVLARMDFLPQASAWVEAFCERLGIAQADCLRLTLIVEELFTNTVKHGHGGDSDAPIDIELSADAAGVTLRYVDSAPAFDLVAHAAAAPPDLDAAVDERRPGGLGVHLLVQMAHSVDYEFDAGRNRIALVLRREA